MGCIPLKIRRSEAVLLILTAIFIALTAVMAYLPTRAPEAVLVKTEIPAPAEQLYLAGDSGETAEPVGIININTAGEDALIHLPGIGSELAQRIVLWRTQHGPFEKPEDIMNVSGIGAKTYEAMAGLITCQEDSQ